MKNGATKKTWLEEMDRPAIEIRPVAVAVAGGSRLSDSRLSEGGAEAPLVLAARLEGEAYQARCLAIEIVQRACAVEWGIPFEGIYEKTRLPDYVTARHVALYLAARLSGLPASRLGMIFARTRHNAYHAIAAVQGWLETDPVFRAQVERLEGRLKETLGC